MKATKESVLNAALAIFPKYGYYDTKVSDICDAVGANVSAVNYYYQSKDNLYLMVWGLLWKDYFQRFKAIADDNSATSREKLARILSMNIHDALADNVNSSLARLSFFEKCAPSPVFGEINRLYFQDVREQFFGLMQDYFDNKADTRTMQIAGMCIREPINGLVTLKIHGMSGGDKEMVKNGLMNDFMNLFDDVDSLTNAIIKYIFGGLEALKCE